MHRLFSTTFTETVTNRSAITTISKVKDVIELDSFIAVIERVVAQKPGIECLS